MPKTKTRRSAAKRFRITKTGKIMRRHSRLRHLLEWKSPKQHRRLKSPAKVSQADRKRVLAMLPGGTHG